MGGFIDAVVDFFEDVFTVITAILIITIGITGIPSILAAVCKECEEFMSDQLGKFFALLGIEEEDVISVDLQDQKLMEGNEDFYRNLITQVALEHQATQTGIIDLLAVKSQGVRGSLQKYSRYGKNQYIDGLPDCSINTVNVNKDVVDAAVQADVGFNVTIQSVTVKVPKENEWVPYRMTKLYGMNQATMEFTYSADTWVMEGYYYDFGVGEYKITAYLKSTPATKVLLGIGNYVPNVGYVVKYIKDGTYDEYYWVYFMNSGNEALDKARSYLTNLDILPIVELRRDSRNVNEDKGSTRYKQTKDILGFIGIDADTIIESINSNPGISNVTAAYIYFGAELGSNNPLQAKMVYHTLEYLYYDPTIVSGGQHQIKVTEGNYNSSISWERQDRIVGSRTGVPIGTYEGGVSSVNVTDTKWTVYTGYVQDEYGNQVGGRYDSDGRPYYFYPDGVYGYGTGEMPFTGILYDINGNELGYVENGYTESYLEVKEKYYGWVRKQETADEYVEYRVWNVSAVTVIRKQGLHDFTMRILAPGSLITMPISHHFVTKFSPIEQGQLFPEILRLVTYAADVQHLKWYQTESFMNLVKVVVDIAAVVVFVFTWYTGGGGVAAFVAAVENILVGMAVGYALKLLLQEIDNPYLRAAVAVVAMVGAALYGGVSLGDNAVIIYGNLVTTAVTNYADAVMENIAEQFAELSAESAVFAGLLKAKEDELEAKQEEMRGYMDVGDVAKLSNMSTAGYIEGVDLKYYRAIQMQYDWELTKSMQPITKIYDYDQYYRLGIS